jgi:hypothetical protein
MAKNKKNIKIGAIKESFKILSFQPFHPNCPKKLPAPGMAIEANAIGEKIIMNQRPIVLAAKSKNVDRKTKLTVILMKAAMTKIKNVR